MAGSDLSPRWVTPKRAAESLGCSLDHLRRMRESGTLKKGKHWRAINPRALRPSYRYNLAAIEKLFDG